MPTVKINLVVSLVPVGARRADIKDQFFALHLSAAFDETTSLADAERLKDLLYPWGTESGSPPISGWTVQKILFRVNNPSPLLQVLKDPLADKKTPTAKPEVLATLQREIGKIKATDPRKRERFLEWSRDSIKNQPEDAQKNRTEEPRLIEAVHNLSLYPGSTPNDSNVLHYFKLDAGDVTLAGGEKIVAVPHLKIKGDLDFVPVPNFNFDFNNFENGWEYQPVDFDGFTLIMTAFVKPLTVTFEASGYINYGDEAPPVIASPDSLFLGPDFKTYWFYSQKHRLWQENLEDFADGAVNSEMRMAEAVSAFINSGKETSALWEDLRLMSLALYAQWGRLPGIDLPSFEIDELITSPPSSDTILDKIQVLLNLSGTEKGELKSIFDRFHEQLKNTAIVSPNARFTARDRNRRLWLNIFRQAFGDREINSPDAVGNSAEALRNIVEEDDQYADLLLKRAAEKPDDFKAPLFYIWDFAVQKIPLQSPPNPLKQKWNDFFHNPAAAQNEAERKKIAAAIIDIFAAAIVKEPLQKKIILELAAKESLDEVKTVIKERLRLLRNYFENAEFVPRIVGQGEPGWANLWNDWQNIYVNKHIAQIFALPVAPPEPGEIPESELKFETKPGGLTIQFDKLDRRSQMSPKEDEVKWRKIAGVGVMVRESSKKWHLATAATVNVNFPEIEIKNKRFVDNKTIEIMVDINAIAGEKHNLIIGNRIFNDVFETRAASSGTIEPADLSITPSFAAPQSTGTTLLIKSLAADLNFTGDSLNGIEFVKTKRNLLETALVPVRVPYKNGVRYPFLTYNQRSLISPTALADAVKSSFNARDTRDFKPVIWTPLYEFGAPDTIHPFYKLVPLKFGKDYQMAAFMIDTAGGLPVELDNVKPFIFAPDENLAPPADNRIVQDFKYWRKVPVGQVRISALEFDNTGANALKPNSWQEVPAKTFPIAWEVEPENKITETHPSEQKQRRKQLILLHEKAEKYAFGVRPPTVDIDVLERWLPFSENEHLKGVLISYFRGINEQNEQPAASTTIGANGGKDLTIDDPAVENFLFVLEEYDFDEKKWKVVSAHRHALPPIIKRSPPGGSIEDYQREWQKVLCLRANNNGVRAANPTAQNEKNFNIVVTVKKDPVNVVRLRVMALVSRDFIERLVGSNPNAKFSNGFFDQEAPADTELTAPPLTVTSPPALKELLFQEDFSAYEYVVQSPDTNARSTVEAARAAFVCLKPHQILLETPNDHLPDAVKLWNSLKLSLSGNRDVVNVSLEAAVNDEDEKIKRRNIIRCELRRQKWRWQGRPVEREKEAGKDGAVSSPPDVISSPPINPLQGDIEQLKTVWAKDGVVADLTSGDEEFLKWEMTAFAELREAFDIITIPIPYSIIAPPLLYRDNFEKDLLARYMRYGLQIFSRYEGLLDVNTVTTKQLFKANDGLEHSLSGTGWKRALVRYRDIKPAKPLVQALVPLTQAFSKGEKVASLMLVLDQTAHAQCGITEEIECELIKVALPEGNVSPPVSPVVSPIVSPPRAEKLYQFGHDPILRAEKFDASSLPDPDIDANRLVFKLTGAFGHTFDTGARQPLFGSSSYVIQGNFAGQDKFNFADWDFAKIRLRRLSGEEKEISAPDEDWTDALWVQFPSSSEFDKEKLAFTLSEDKIFTVDVAAVDRFPMFKYCLLLTRLISDFRGQKGSETYIGWVNMNRKSAQTGTLQGTFEDVISNPKDLKARLVEVQVTKNNVTHEFEELPGNGDEFWKQLLQIEDDENKDSSNIKYRITRVSSAFDVKDED